MNDVGARALMIAALCTAACATTAPAMAPRAPHAASTASTHPSPPPLPSDIVARSAVRFHGVRRSDGATVTADQLLEQLSSADAICAGESHDNPRHHYLQLRIFQHLLERAPQTGRRVALGLEMVQRPFQSVLDAYEHLGIDEATLTAQSEWQQRWGFDFALYQPLFEVARDSSAHLVALNAPRELTRKIAESGLGALAPHERQTLPEMVLDDKAHRAYFDAAMKQHPAPKEPKPERAKPGHDKPAHPTSGPSETDVEHYYQAQVLWDETMASAAAEWLQASDEARQILIVAGLGHCHERAIPSRIKRRLPVKVVSVRPLDPSEPLQPSIPSPTFDYDIVIDGPATF